jgi:hypothetical protein
MKTVVFASIHDAARCKIAAAFFNAFTMPSLARGACWRYQGTTTASVTTCASS